ncbi:MAG TPA: hypothetical protein VEC99_12045, partial [Clostridia bacterium]|nr:hypothetical protein [Clostridia bacterium]
MTFQVNFARAWAKLVAPACLLLLCCNVVTAAINPPPAGQEASYEWYVAQHPDPVIFTPIGPPGDPAEIGVSPRGQLMQGKLAYSEEDGTIGGTPFVTNSLTFGLLEHGCLVPIGSGIPAKQSLWEGRFPIVFTDWQHGDFAFHQTAFARPLRGESYTTGLEATIAWALFDITNTSKETKELAFVASWTADEKELQRKMSFRDEVVFEKDSAVFTAKAPKGFEMWFEPVLIPQTNTTVGLSGLELLRNGGAYNALVMRGRCKPGQTVHMAVGCVFQFPGTRHWGPSPVKVAAEKLTKLRPERELAKAKETWLALAGKLNCFETPDPMLNRIVAKAMLDGYFLT